MTSYIPMSETQLDLLFSQTQVAKKIIPEGAELEFSFENNTNKQLFFAVISVVLEDVKEDLYIIDMHEMSSIPSDLAVKLTNMYVMSH